MTENSHPPRTRTVEVAAGIVVDCRVVDTLLGEHVRMPRLPDVMAVADVRWWGFAPVSATNLLGVSTQVPRAHFLIADHDPGLHRRLHAEVDVRDVPRWDGLDWWVVTVIALLAEFDMYSEYPEPETIHRIADGLAGRADPDLLAAAADGEPPEVAARVDQLVGLLQGRPTPRT